MVLVLLGTQENNFERLLKEVEKAIENNIIKEDVIVQAGSTKYNSSKMKILDFISPEELNKCIEKANYIITHGGVGSILGAIKNNKKVIAIPRKKEFKEHVNNHQMQIVENFNNEGYIIGIKNVEELQTAIAKIENFKPKQFISSTENVIKIIEDFIY